MAGNDVDFRAVASDIIALLRSASSVEGALEEVVAALKDKLPHYDWVGIYLLRGEMLELGPYRGEPSPHNRIPLGRGICGAAASAKETIVVPDVNADPRYLACSLKTRSEIVVPIMHQGTCFGEIDIDSHTPDAFSLQDRIIVESIAGELAKRLAE